MGLREVLEYLVVLQLSGRSNAVKALYAYFSNGGFGSVSELARRYGLSRAQLRSYVQRILEKVPGRCRASRARLYVRYLAPIVLEVKPIIELRNGKAFCRLCNEEMPRDSLATYEHVASTHRRLVNDVVDRIVELLRACCRAPRGDYRG